jgi:hypothetical protein
VKVSVGVSHCTEFALSGPIDCAIFGVIGPRSIGALQPPLPFHRSSAQPAPLAGSSVVVARAAAIAARSLRQWAALPVAAAT